MTKQVVRTLMIGLVALGLLPACDSRRPEPSPHRLVASNIDHPSQLPPSTPSEWAKALKAEEPCYPQYLFLPDGTHVVGGVFMGHGNPLECLETSSLIRVRVLTPDGRVAEGPLTNHIVGADLIRMGQWPPSDLVALFRRTGDIGQSPSLAKYKDRL
jgi:hypothetical protein